MLTLPRYVTHRHYHAAKLCRRVNLEKSKVLIEKKKHTTFVAIEGTCTPAHWLDNLTVYKREDAHAGFDRHCDDCIDQFDLAKLFSSGEQLIVTGHSLGAATAILLTQKLRMDNVREFVMFGCPRVGGELLRERILKAPLPKVYAYRHKHDAVSFMPPSCLGYVSMLDDFVVDLPTTCEIGDPWIKDHDMNSYVSTLQLACDQNFLPWLR
jgi:hypothetical protein